MQISSLTALPLLAAILAVAACSGAPAEQPQAEEGAESIQCALGDGSEFGADCLVERDEVGGQKILVIRHPDGGFRRFVQLDDGRGLAELDGADQVARTLENGMLLITIGQDRYRFPAAIQTDQAAPEQAAAAAEPAPAVTPAE